MLEKISTVVKSVFKKNTDNLDKAELSFSTLPMEMQILFLSYLSPKELCDIASVNKDWKKLSEDNILWDKFLPKLQNNTDNENENVKDENNTNNDASLKLSSKVLYKFSQQFRRNIITEIKFETPPTYLNLTNALQLNPMQPNIIGQLAENHQALSRDIPSCFKGLIDYRVLNSSNDFKLCKEKSNVIYAKWYDSEDEKKQAVYTHETSTKSLGS